MLRRAGRATKRAMVDRRGAMAVEYTMIVALMAPLVVMGITAVGAKLEVQVLAIIAAVLS